MKYIKSLGQDSFYKLNRKDLSDEMTIMHNDIITLSDNGCLLNDLNLDNTIYHNGVYLIDPGSYDVKYLYKKENIKTYGLNIDRVNEYFINIFSKRCRMYYSGEAYRLKRREIISEVNSHGGPINYMMSGIRSENLECFIKEKIR